jgi:Immunity protein 31
MMKAKFQFYEVVRILEGQGVRSHLVGREGVVSGSAQNDKGEWSYAVFIPSTELTWSFDETNLAATGEFRKREDFYSGESIKVKVIGGKGLAC